jgi:hypothetical protein
MQAKQAEESPFGKKFTSTKTIEETSGTANLKTHLNSAKCTI